jgi:hypothetical protein
MKVEVRGETIWTNFLTSKTISGVLHLWGVAYCALIQIDD